LVQRKREAFTLGFDVCPLSSPAAEEGLVPFLGIEGCEVSLFVEREVSSSDGIYVEISTDSFHINAQFPTSAERKQS
jgi:hypothetical protein